MSWNEKGVRTAKPVHVVDLVDDKIPRLYPRVLRSPLCRDV